MERPELIAHLAQLGVPPAGCKLVVNALRDAPVRDVGSKIGNIVTKYFSRKMGCHLRLESRTGELPAAIRHENDSAVRAYLAQPVKLDLLLTDGGSKKPYRIPHVPDFLVVTNTGVFIEEWHPAEWLEEECQLKPGRYVKDDGRWRWPEVEAFLGARGIEYRLRANEEHPTIFVRNAEFLADYYAEDPIDSDTGSSWLALQARFSERAAIPLAELIGEVIQADTAPPFTADDIYRAIAQGRLSFDLDGDILDETPTAVIYRDAPTMMMARRIAAAGEAEAARVFSINPGDTITYDGSPKLVVLVGGSSVILTDDAGTTEVDISLLKKLHQGESLELVPVKDVAGNPFDALNALTSDEIDRANRRARAIELANAGTPDPTVPVRTLQSWKRLQRNAGPDLFASNAALAGRHRHRGNRQRKVSTEIITAIKDTAREDYNKPNCITKHAAYKKFIDRCQTRDLIPCSYRTFRIELNQLEKTRAREGKRMAYQTSPITPYLNPLERIHGVRPFQYVHMDHTISELELIDPFGRSLGRPTLSLAMDADSRDVLGLYLSLLPPSYLSCMMLFRDIARRWGRLPETVVVDNGKEFHSHTFERFCSLYRINIRYRPAAQPRTGSTLERLFRTTDLQLVNNLSGNTKAMKAVRTVTKSHLPKNHATWTLPAFYGALDFYFSELYGTENHPALDQSPREYMARRLLETGERRNRLVRLDETFLIETCPEVERGTRVIDSQRGVKIDHVHYTCDAVRKPQWHGKAVPAKVDPWDASRCFVLLDKQWHTCVAHARLAVLRGMSRVEMLAYFEQRRVATGTKKKELTEQRIADWMRAYTPTAFDSRLQAEIKETRSIYDVLGISGVTKSDTTVGPSSSMSRPESEQSDVEETCVIDSSANGEVEDYGTF